MPLRQLRSSAAVLLVRDIVAAAEHYRDKLGFSFEAIYGDPPSYCILHRDACHLMLKQAADPQHVIPHWTVSDKTSNIYFWVHDADALHRELLSRGAKIDFGPCDQPYGYREFGVQDLDGYDLSFGQPLSAP